MAVRSEPGRRLLGHLRRTRPLGASFADWFGKPLSATGLGLGDGLVTGVALVVFVALVASITTTRRDVQSGSDREPAPSLDGQYAAAG